jgi:hypothetical protein
MNQLNFNEEFDLEVNSNVYHITVSGCKYREDGYWYTELEEIDIIDSGYQTVKQGDKDFDLIMDEIQYRDYEASE